MATTTNNKKAGERLGALSEEQGPVLETVMRLHLDTIELCNLDARTYHLVRLAALVASGAPPMSYLAFMTMAQDAGVSAEEAEAVLVAIAPITGAPRITAAAGNILRGLGIGAVVEESRAS